MFCFLSGVFVLLAECRIGVGNGSLDLFADAIGYFLLLKGMDSFKNINIGFQKIAPKVQAFEVFTMLLFFCQLFGIIPADAIFSVLFLVPSIYILNEIRKTVTEAEESGSISYVNARFMGNAFAILCMACVVRAVCLAMPSAYAIGMLAYYTGGLLFFFSMLNVCLKMRKKND